MIESARFRSFPYKLAKLNDHDRTDMHGMRFDILKWILGANSNVYKQLTLSPRDHGLPEIEESLLLRCFEDFAIEACQQQSEHNQAIQNKHFDDPLVAGELQGWLRYSQLLTGNDGMKRLIYICILVRDFVEICEYVENKWVVSIEVDRAAEAGSNDGGNTAKGFAALNELVQRRAAVVFENIPHYREGDCDYKWSLRHETWKTAKWHHTIERVKTEARVIFCGEMIQQEHDATATAWTMCNFLTKVRGSLDYTARDVVKWYGQDDLVKRTYNMKMVCDVYNYKSVTATTENVRVPPVPREQLTVDMTLEKLRVVVVFCSNLVFNVDESLLQKIVPIDLTALKLLVMIYDKIRDRSVAQQQQVLMSVSRVSHSLAILHHGCSEMERCLRMYVYLNHLKSADHTARLLAILVTEGVFSARDDVCSLFRAWLCNHTGLASEDSAVSSAVIRWGGHNLALFCTRCNAYLREHQEVVHEIVLIDQDDGCASDASHLLDPLLFEEYFGAQMLLDK